MEELKKWPLDFESLQKGDTIGKKELERVLNAVCGSDAFVFGGLQLRATIMKTKELLGDPVVVRFFKKTGIMVILDDEEAMDHTNRWVKNRLKSAMAYMRRHTQVDMNRLPPAKQQRFQLDVLRNSRISQALLHARAKRPRLNPGKE